jgi:hypothetical protein
MVDFGKTIDKLIKISAMADLTDEVKMVLDDVIDELINTELTENENIVPDYSSLSPDELEEIKQFEIFVRGVMDGEVAQA